MIERDHTVPPLKLLAAISASVAAFLLTRFAVVAMQAPSNDFKLLAWEVYVFASVVWFATMIVIAAARTPRRLWVIMIAAIVATAAVLRSEGSFS